MTLKGYYFITDAGLSRAGNASDTAKAVAAGVKVVQYRNKNGSTLELHREACALREICRDIVFLVNDRIDIALSCNADGVHIGQDDMPYAEARRLLGKGKIIGLTVHNVQEAVEAEKAGADYAGASPVFQTGTKLDAGRPAGLKLIEDIKKNVRIPVIAIGGINLANARDVIKAGADGLCAISAVVASDDAGEAVKRFQELFLT